MCAELGGGDVGSVLLVYVQMIYVLLRAHSVCSLQIQVTNNQLILFSTVFLTRQKHIHTMIVVTVSRQLKFLIVLRHIFNTNMFPAGTQH